MERINTTSCSPKYQVKKNYVAETAKANKRKSRRLDNQATNNYSCINWDPQNRQTTTTERNRNTPATDLRSFLGYENSIDYYKNWMGVKNKESDNAEMIWENFKWIVEIVKK